MIIITCLDDAQGLMFNHRRQSRDRVVTEDILKECQDRPLYMNQYSSSLFEEKKNKIVCEDFLEQAGEGDFCFVEDRQLLPYLDKIEKILVYRWNRDYPHDLVFDLNLQDSWKLIHTKEFPGFSHEKITKEAYMK